MIEIKTIISILSFIVLSVTAKLFSDMIKQMKDDIKDVKKENESIKSNYLDRFTEVNKKIDHSFEVLGNKVDDIKNYLLNKK